MDDIRWNVQVCHGNDDDGYTESAVTFDTRDEALQFIEDYLEELDVACETQAANNGVIRLWSSAANQLIEL
jgi:hypothetical protein